MQHFTIQGCSNCGSLRDVYDAIECSIIDIAKRKWANAQFNTSLSVNEGLLADLLVLKRIVYKRMYNPSYPSTAINAQDIITQAKLRAYKSECSQCTTCFPAGSESSSSSSSSTSTSTTIA